MGECFPKFYLIGWPQPRSKPLPSYQPFCMEKVFFKTPFIYCMVHVPLSCTYRAYIGNCRDVRGLGSSMVVFCLFEKLRYSNERSTTFASVYQFVVKWIYKLLVVTNRKRSCSTFRHLGCCKVYCAFCDVFPATNRKSQATGYPSSITKRSRTARLGCLATM